jgi:PqqD family protein of HPr-rel-A system
MGAPTPELPRTMPARASGLARVAVDDEEVVFDAAHGRTHRLNPTAALVLDRCDGSTPTEDVCRGLHDRFGADVAELADDLAAVLHDFARRQLVSSDPSGASERLAPEPDPGPAGAPTALADEPVHARRFVTGPLRALDVSAIVTTDDEHLAAEVAARLGSLASGPASSGLPLTTYELVPADRGVDVRADGRTVGNARGVDAALALVQWHLNRLVAARAGRRLQLHASAVRLADGRMAVFPGEVNAGKSTLVAGLVRAGYGYVTDEMVAVEIGTGWAEGYRKPINLDPGSWPLFPGVVPADAADRGDEHLVDPKALHPDALAGPSDGDVGLVAFPAFRAGGPTRTTSISTAAALVALVSHCTNLATHGQAGLDTLAQLVRGAPAFELDMGGLDEAVRAVDALVHDRAAPV